MRVIRNLHVDVADGGWGMAGYSMFSDVRPATAFIVATGMPGDPLLQATELHSAHAALA